jgi:hypothetical protein
MLAAHHYARSVLDVRLDLTNGGRAAWGWQGRTLGLPVTSPAAAWLRVASDPHHYDTFWWNGTSEATSLPDSLPRPLLRATHHWTDPNWRYRADLFDRTPAPVSTTLVLDHDPSLPASWWTQLRGALRTLTGVPTSRLAVRQARLDSAMPAILGPGVPTRSPGPWTTCHGDLHFGNVCGPNLIALDWEGWGLSPAGYDAARLYLTSLACPDTAAKVRRELAAHLDNPGGRFAELVVITELLSNDSTRSLSALLRGRAQELTRDGFQHGDSPTS